MPETKFQQLVFAFLTVSLSAFAFVLYNISLSMWWLTNEIFLITLNEFWHIGIIAFIIQITLVWYLSSKMAFRIVDKKKDKPIFIILAITCMNICIMCPLMTFIVTFIYDGFTLNFLSNWLTKIFYNFPFAFFIEIFLIWPFIRLIFRNIFHDKQKKILKLEEYEY